MFGKHFVFLINKGGVRGRRKGRGDNKKKRRLKINMRNVQKEE